jgi:TPP-dependent pyruvate/acetoin dehydrogenase alpha subunit
LIERLKGQGLWKEEEWARMEGEVAEEISQAIDFAEAGNWERIEDLARFVYSEARSH